MQSRKRINPKLSVYYDNNKQSVVLTSIGTKDVEIVLSGQTKVLRTGETLVFRDLISESSNESTST